MKYSVFIGILLIMASCNTKEENKLPIYSPADFNPELVDQTLQHQNQNYTVSNFELIDQNGIKITQEDFKDKIYVVDFFFTRCGSICPIMTTNLKKIQKEFLKDDDIRLLSISVTPEIDSISILRSYADRNGVIDAKWRIATGMKKHIYELARKSYFAVVEQGDGGLQDFIHTPNFILVDKRKQIRGVYNGTNKDDIQRLIQDINTLKTSS